MEEKALVKIGQTEKQVVIAIAGFAPVFLDPRPALAVANTIRDIAIELLNAQPSNTKLNCLEGFLRQRHLLRLLRLSAV